MLFARIKLIHFILFAGMVDIANILSHVGLRPQRLISSDQLTLLGSVSSLDQLLIFTL